MSTPTSRVLRIAHLTDLHIQPELESARGLERCLEHAQSHQPDLIFMGGDLVMDSLWADRDRRDAQWDLYTDVVRANASIPVVTALGNHDVWGWGEAAKHESDPHFGKRYALDRLEMERSYYRFGRAGWHFIVLDSTHRSETEAYTARLDDDQFAWLESELAAIPADQPVLVLSHIPIFSACTFLHGDNEQTGQWRVPGAWMHLDVRRIQRLFRQHPNVRTCLSGHMHLVDRVDYMGVTYYCNGAVCGSWWNGPFHDFPNGYAIVDLYEDGTVQNQTCDFGFCYPPQD